MMQDSAAAISLMQLASGYWASAALGAAVQCGLFDAISSDPRPAEQVANFRGLDVRATAALLDALAGMGIVNKTEAGYAVSPAFAELLTPGGARDMLPALRFNLDLYPLWGRLGEVVRTGRPAALPGAHLGDDADRTRRFVEGMHSRAMALGPMILCHVDVADRGKLLDVGAGPGTFGRQLAANHAQLHVTLLDLPGVLAVARRLTDGHPAANRISFVEADYRKDDWCDTRGGAALCPGLPPEGNFDAVLYCGALHQESTASAAALMKRLYETLEPGGKLFVVDLMFEEDGVRPGFAGLFALNMMLFNPQARVFRRSEVERLLCDAGFANVRSQRAGESAYATVTGAKP